MTLLPGLSFIRRYAGQSRGATAVEFAFIAVPLLAIIFSIIQMALVFFLNEALQTVAEQAGRQLMTGKAQTAGLNQANFLTNDVCPKVPPVFLCGVAGGVMVDVESYSSFSAVSTTPLTITYDAKGNVNNTWSYVPGNAGDIVIVRVMYEWPIVGGPLGVLLANQSNNTRLLVGTTVLKNEPF
jgi:Flp pilus assembly protein TadG